MCINMQVFYSTIRNITNRGTFLFFFFFVLFLVTNQLLLFLRWHLCFVDILLQLVTKETIFFAVANKMCSTSSIGVHFFLILSLYNPLLMTKSSPATSMIIKQNQNITRAICSCNFVFN